MIKIAILCPSEIAYRRFMPALKKVPGAVFVGIGHANEKEWFGNVSKKHDLSVLQTDLEKAKHFVKTFGGKVFDSFEDVYTSNEVDAVYIPLPPGLHFKWAKLALENGKHVLVEKPSTVSLEETRKLVKIAEEKKLALHENYMFVFHSQLSYIEQIIRDEIIGEVRLFRISFGFPFRGNNDFRYNKKLGGGALLDCGGYTIKLASILLGPTARLVTHQLNYKDGYDVDIFGSGTMANDKGQVAQLSFGMDNSYKCDLEIWGSTGSLLTGRILTAPDGFEPSLFITSSEGSKEIKLESDDSFKKSIMFFASCIVNKNDRKKAYGDILKQAAIVDEFKVK